MTPYKFLSIHLKRARVFFFDKIKKDLRFTVQRLIWQKSICRFRHENRNVNAIFIVGCGHSGTSLLYKILSTHTDIHSVGGESRLFNRESHNLLHIVHTLNSWVCAMEEKEKSIFIEKTPTHVHSIKIIKLLFPQNKILFITRNPLDNIASLFKRYGNLERAIFRYFLDNWVGLRLDPHVHRLKYEALLTNFDEAILDIQAYCNVNQEDLSAYHGKKTFFFSELLTQPEYYAQKTHNATRNYQVNQPISDTRGQHVHILNRTQIETVKGQVSNISDKLGYDDFSSNSISQNPLK